MKMLKTLTAASLSLIFALSAAGCGGSSGGLTVQEGVLTWGTNAEFAPYEYIEGDQVVGIDAEIADSIAAKLGLTAQVENMKFDSVIPSVTTGKVDIGLAGLTISEERLQNVSFSTPYIEAYQVIIVPEGSDIASVEDLKGKVVGVQTATTGDEYVSAEENGTGVADIERYPSGPDAAAALLAGKIDAVVIDNEPAKSIVENSSSLVILDEPLTSEQYAIAVAKENTELLEAINGALEEMKENGELQAILDKYLDSEEAEAVEEEAGDEVSAEETEEESTEDAEAEEEADEEETAEASEDAAETEE